MRLMDLNDGESYSLTEVFKEWQQLRKEDPVNHSDSFKRELFDILDATLRGRNDVEVVGMTGAELFRFYSRLMMEV